MSDSQALGSLLIARQNRLLELLNNFDLDMIAVNPGPGMKYLTGLNFHLMERPVIGFFRNDGRSALVLPELETLKLESLPLKINWFAYGENPADWMEVFRNAVQFMKLENQKVGVEPTRLRFLELKLLEQAAPQADFVSAAESLGMLRARKDAAEVAAMRKAVEIAEAALETTLNTIRIGKSEREIATELTLNLLREGSDVELPFSPIISSGPNSANPHATPGERLLQEGDLLVIDWGASYNGYISDLTRTFAIGTVDHEFDIIAGIVAKANEAGKAAAKPEIMAGNVDQAARQMIIDAGYGANFIHRTGHGIGMEAHEEPYIRSGNTLLLQPGMTFTVEPGIYLPGRGGVRIEDNLVITKDGAECLSRLPRELRVITN